MLCFLASLPLVKLLLPVLLILTTFSFVSLALLRLKLAVFSDGLLWPSGICGESCPALLTQLMPPLLDGRKFAEAWPSEVSFLLLGSLINVTIGSLVHRGLRPDSKYCTNSTGSVSGIDGGVGSGLRLSLEPKDQRRGNTLLSASLALLGALILTLRP